mgnify:CR=1 FL=1
MILCKDLNKEFATKEEMFLAIAENRQIIIDAKKANKDKSEPISFYSIKAGLATKADDTPLKFGDYIYPIINTTNYIDTHGDVHIPGIWNKSLKEQAGKIYYVINHDLEIGKVISYPAEIEILTKKMKWRELGKDYNGTTEALIFKAKVTEKSNRDAYLAFQAKEAIENSVRMGYVAMTLCVDSKSPDFINEKENYDYYLPMIANKEVAEEQGYFWAITEAKIVKEGSAVLFGSNDVTPVLYSLKNIEPLKSTQAEPGRPLKKLNELLNHKNIF